MPDSLRALIVEDSENDALLMVNEFEFADIKIVYQRVETAQAMADALSTDRWDFILADYRMPHFSGNEALALVKNHGLDIPFILVSGKIGEETAVDAMKAGAHDYVMKDNLARLVPAVQRELREAQVRRDRKRADEALRESEERYRTLIESMNEGFGIQDSTGRITYANNKLCEMLQCSPEEIIGCPINDFLDAFDQTVEHLPNMVKHTSYDVTWRGKNGRKVATIMSPRPLFNFRGEFIGSCAVITDITERKRREEELQQLRHRLELILNSAWEGVVGLDLQGRFTFVNPSAAAMLGYQVQELIGRRAHDTWHHSKPDGSPYPEESCAIYACLRQGAVYHSIDEILWKKDGTGLEAELSVNPILEGRHITGAVVTFWDITSRNQAERAIQESKETLEAIFNAITESVILLDRDGHIVSLNDTAAQRLGNAQYSLVGKCFQDLLPPDVAREREAKVEMVLRSGEPVRFEDVREGSVFAHHVYPVFGNNGEVERLAIFATDISEQRHARDALQQSEERLKTVFECAQDGIFIADQDLKLTHVNPAVERLAGRPAQEFIGKNPEDLFTEAESAYLRDVGARVLKGELVELEHTLRLTEVPVALHSVLVPMRDSEGQIVGVCGIARDVTDRKRAEVPVFASTETYPSEAMRSTLARANLAAQMQSTVLLLGESGSGKDFLARYIHNHSKRADGPYFAINCAAITSSLAESELFGHERGSFTGAQGRKRGLLELAEGGTILLNEIGDLPLTLQSKLLAFLDTRKFTRVGGEKEISVNARLLAATNRDLEKDVKNGTFRKDLFYRLNVMSIRVPPLRERRADIPILVREIVSELSVELQLPDLPTVDSAAMNALQQATWAGNVRELRNVLERALILSRGREIDLSPLGLQTADKRPSNEWSFTVPFPTHKPVSDLLDDLRGALADEALLRCQGSKTKAARLLGISRDSFYRYIKSGVKEQDGECSD